MTTHQSEEDDDLQSDCGHHPCRACLEDLREAINRDMTLCSSCYTPIPRDGDDLCVACEADLDAMPEAEP